MGHVYMCTFPSHYWVDGNCNCNKLTILMVSSTRYIHIWVFDGFLGDIQEFGIEAQPEHIQRRGKSLCSHPSSSSHTCTLVYTSKTTPSGLRATDWCLKTVVFLTFLLIWPHLFWRVGKVSTSWSSATLLWAWYKGAAMGVVIIGLPYSTRYAPGCSNLLLYVCLWP